VRSTIAGNGGGLKTSGGQVEVRNTILASNGFAVSGPPSYGEFNLLNVTAQVAGLETDGNGFPVLKDNGGPTATVALVAGSRAINAANPAINAAFDQRDTPFARVVGGRADIGAFELQGSSGSVQKASVKPSAHGA